MRLFPVVSAVIIVATILVLSGPSADAVSRMSNFENTSDNVIIPSFMGADTFRLNQNLTDGVHTLNSGTLNS
jgi:hypothetical protein